MLKKILISVLASVAAVVPAHADVNGSGTDGAISRAVMLADTRNYGAALDCLRSVDTDGMAPERLEWLRYFTATTLLGAGDYRGAEEALASYLAGYPYSPRRAEVRKGLGDCAFARGDYAHALGEYRQVSAAALSGADAASMSYRAGIASLAQGDMGAARTWFEAATKDPSMRPQANFYMGYIAFASGDYPAARGFFKNVNTAVAPGNMAGYYLAEIDFSSGLWSKALSQARHMLSRRDLSAAEKAEMQRVAGESLWKMDRRSEALDYLRSYVSAASSPAPSALYLVGVADYDEGDYDKALTRLRPVTECSDPALAQSAYLYVGQALMHCGDNSAAILAFDKATRSDADQAVREAAFYNYAVAKMAGGSVPFGSSVETLEEFLRLYPSGPYSDRVSEYLAGGYMADNDYTRALERLERIKNPGQKVARAKLKAHTMLASRALAADDLAEATRHLDKAATIDASDAEASLLRAAVLDARGKHSEAATAFRTYLRTAAADDPNTVRARYGLGYALFAQERYTDADAAFADALKARGLTPDVRADILSRRADICYAAGKYNEAARLYGEAYKALPASGDYAAFNMARMKGFARDYEGKLAALASFRSEFPSSVLMPDALLETTQAQISLGRNGDAVTTYRKLIADYPGTAQGRRGYLQMAMTLLDMDRREDAAEAYRSVIRLYPTSDEATQASSLLKNLYAEQGRGDEYLEFINSVSSAPIVDADEAAALTFDAAVKAMRGGSDAKLLAFVNQFPDNPRTAKALNMLAEADYAAGRIPEALERWQQAAAKASDTATATAARMGIMRSARDMGQYELAGTTADAILASSTSTGTRAEARFTKAQALDAAGRTTDAIAIWQAMAAEPAELYGAKSAFYAAEALHEAGENDRALELARTFVQSGSPHRYWVARGFILMSDIYSAKGMDLEAREYLEALRENYPGTETDIFLMIDSRLEK